MNNLDINFGINVKIWSTVVNERSIKLGQIRSKLGRNESDQIKFYLRWLENRKFSRKIVKMITKVNSWIFTNSSYI